MPKKFAASQVISLGTELLSNTGINCQAARSTSRIVEVLQLEQVNPLLLLPPPADFPGRPATAGMVWCPLKEVKLSAEAGAALRRCLLRCKSFDGVEDDAEHVVLEARGCPRPSAGAQC